MKVSQKLKIIYRISGKTQQELAQELGVSFATLNSWINERSQPHKSNERRIDEFYKTYTGEREIPDEELSAKKQLLQRRSQKYKNIIRAITKRQDIYDDFMLALTFNSNRIEGSTLSEGETAAILFENATIPNKSVIEHMEAKNHQAAVDFLFTYAAEKRPLNEEFILKLHSIILNGISQEAGSYRRHGVRIVGSNVPTANYVKIPDLMRSLAKGIKKSKKDIIGHTANIHAQFEKIHPFADGNGRVGRLLMHAMLLRRNLPPAVIVQEERALYLQYLRTAQLDNRHEPFEDLLCEAVSRGFDILENE